MSDSRESSPDWLRSYQVPTDDSPLAISSNSGSAQDNSVSDEDEADQGESSIMSIEAASRTGSKRKKGDNQKKEGCGKKRKVTHESKDGKHNESIHSVWDLSSDSESGDHTPKREDHGNEQESNEKLPQEQTHQDDHTPLNAKSAKIRAKGKATSDEAEVKEEGTSEKHVKSNVSSGLPLMLSEKVQRTKALIECEGDSIDLSGDVGAVGRIMISDSPSGVQEMYLDLKGTIYKTAIIPSRTFCVVSLGQSEAKIEAIMNDFIQLKPQSNVYEAETMVEGTLDGFSFDSDEEPDKLPKAKQTDQNEQDEEPNNKKANRKTDKTSAAAKKRGRSVGGKPPAPKKIRKKVQVSKKAKAKK